MATFTLTIELGNQAIQTGEDVAAALRNIAENVETFYHDTKIQPDYCGIRRDANGSRIAEWSVES